MPSQATQITAFRTLRALRRRAWLIILCAVVVGGAAYLFSKSQPNEYTASAALLFQSSALQQEASGLPGGASVETDRQAATNVSLVTLGGIAAKTAQVVGGGLTPQAVAAAVKVSAAGTTNLASVSATFHSPRRAMLVANQFATQFIAARKAVQQQTLAAGIDLVQQQIAGMSRAQRGSVQGVDTISRLESLKLLSALQTGDAQLVQRAGVPRSPSSPKTKRNTALGLVLGLLIGLLIVLVLERLDRRIRDIHELEEAYSTTVLGQVPESEELTVAQHADGVLVLPPQAESFRLLRAHLRYFNVDRKLRTVQVTSVQPGDGKTTVAWNLAATTATMGVRTLLIEADLRRPKLAEVLGVSASPGVAQVLVQETPASEAAQSVKVAARANDPASRTSMDVLVAGAVPPNPTELVDSEAMRRLLQWGAESYDLVIVDAPPPGLVSEALTLLAGVDGVLIVARIGRHTRDAVRRLHRDLDTVDAHVLGIVVNGFKAPRGYGYGYGYGYEAGYETSSGDRRKLPWRKSASPSNGQPANGAQPEPVGKNGTGVEEPEGVGSTRPHE